MSETPKPIEEWADDMVARRQARTDAAAIADLERRVSRIEDVIRRACTVLDDTSEALAALLGNVRD